MTSDSTESELKRIIGATEIPPKDRTHFQFSPNTKLYLVTGHLPTKGGGLWRRVTPKDSNDNDTRPCV